MEFFHTHISQYAIEEATRVLKSGWVSEGEAVKKFETNLSKMLGLSNCIAVNSGTSALHLGLALANVGPEDEVIIPAQTFVATGLVVLMQGATPVFADIDPLTGNISTHSILNKITSQTKAIIPVHWGGYPCDLDEINYIAKQNNIVVIEDAAHALGATYKEIPIGSVSRFTAFSFQAIKHLTTCDGGALCCTKYTDAEEAVVRRWFGIDRANSIPSNLGERLYNINKLGYKYHMNDLSASVGIGNLYGFKNRLLRRQEIGSYYRRNLTNISGIQLLQFNKNRTHSYWFFTMLVENREALISKLNKCGIPSSVVHLSIDRNSIFGGLREDLEGQTKFNDLQLSIPSHECLSDDNLEHIVTTIRNGW